MTTLVVGSIALDTVETPFGVVQDVVGGTAVYFSLAASLFTDVNLVGVAGQDFPSHGIELLLRRGVDLSGLQRQPGDTFRWSGRYFDDMNVAHTRDTQLNVFESFQPELPEAYRDSDIVFLGNIDPDLQLDVLQQVRKPVLSALDTMNFWIERKRESLAQVLRAVDLILINEGEIRQFTGRRDIVQAAYTLMDLGPRYVVVKRGEYGAMMITEDALFAVPAFPTADVQDTTGAGDSFAGGFLGYLDRVGRFGPGELRTAMVYGTATASHTVEDFSVSGLLRGSHESLYERYTRLAEMTRVDLPSSDRFDGHPDFTRSSRIA